MGSLNALIADVGRNALLKTGMHVEGMMFSCSSIGIKVGTGIGTAVTGWMLTFGGYVSLAETQTAGAISMIKFCYAGMPCILIAIITLCLWKLDVGADNQRLEAAKSRDNGSNA